MTLLLSVSFISTVSSVTVDGYLQLVSFAGTNYCDQISNVINYAYNSAGICYPVSTFPSPPLEGTTNSVKVTGLSPLGSAIFVQGFLDSACKVSTTLVNNTIVTVYNNFTFHNDSQGICPQGGVLQITVPKFFISIGPKIPASPMNTYANFK